MSNVTVSDVYKKIFDNIDKLDRGLMSGVDCKLNIEALRAEAEALGLDIKSPDMNDLVSELEAKIKVQRVLDKLDRVEEEIEEWCTPSYDDDDEDEDSY